MASETKPSTGGFLAVLEARYAALGRLIESYRDALSLGALGQPGDVDLSDTPVSGQPAGVAYDLPTGALLGKSIPGAAKLYLSAVRKKQTTREITTALRDGGVESTAANFENTVTSALHRLKAAGEVLKFKDGWALAELYPENLRNRIAKEQNGKAAPKRAKVKKRTRTRSTSKAEKAQGTGKPESIDTRIATFLRAHPAQRFAPKQVGEALNEANVKAVGMAFARLVRFGKVTRAADGFFAVAHPPVEHLKAV
jgi:hypothetical protein